MVSKNKPLVTVICNCLNHEAYVLEALDSVLAQSYKNIELIVINNGSTDASGLVIHDFVKDRPEVKFIDLEKTLSHNIAFNLAAKDSSGDYLIDLSGDDRLLPDSIIKQLHKFQNTKGDVGMVFGNALEIDGKGNFLKNYFETDANGKVLDKGLHHTTYDRLLAGGLCICAVTTMYSRRHFELLGGYSEALFFEDLDFWLRMSYRHKIEFIDDFLVEKRYLPTSFGAQSFQKNKISKKINDSLIMIFRDAMLRNSAEQNKLLLKRIHNRMQVAYEKRDWFYLLKFSLVELECRASSLFKKI